MFQPIPAKNCVSASQYEYFNVQTAMPCFIYNKGDNGQKRVSDMLSTVKRSMPLTHEYDWVASLVLF